MNDLIAVEKIAQWEKLKALVLDSVSSPITKRVYNMALNEFMAWFQQAPRPGFTKATVSAWRVSLEERRLGSSSIIIRMSAIRKLAAEAADNGLLAPELAQGISRVKSVKSTGIRVGNWLSQRQAQALLSAPDIIDGSRAARSRDPGRSSRLRTPAIGSGGAHVRARPAARWALVHRRSRRKARPRPNCADADMGESGDRRVDVAGSGIATGHVFRPVNRPAALPATAWARRSSGRCSGGTRPRLAFPVSRLMT